MSQAQSQFVFRAMTPTGGKTFGLRPAANEGALAEALRRDQLLLLGAWKLPFKAGPASAMKLKDEAAFNDQLGLMLERGVPLTEALEVAMTVVTEDTRPRVEQIRELVSSGDAFSQAASKTGGFDQVTVAVYAAAERTGDLAGAAKRLALAARRRMQVRGKAITVTIYPSVVFSIAILIFFGVLTFLVPMVADQMAQMGVELNPFSDAVFSLGLWMRDNLPRVLIFFAGLAFAAYFGRSVMIGVVTSLLRRVGAIDRMMLTVELARFFSVMAAMVRSGVPLADALSTATLVISNPGLRAQFESLQKGLVEGGVWRSLVEKVDMLPLATRKLLIAAERSGDLDSAFDSLSTDLAEEVDTRSARLLALLEPAAILLMFAVVGPLVLAIAIPLLTFKTSAG